MLQHTGRKWLAYINALWILHLHQRYQAIHFLLHFVHLIQPLSPPGCWRHVDLVPSFKLPCDLLLQDLPQLSLPPREGHSGCVQSFISTSNVEMNVEVCTCPDWYFVYSDLTL